MEGKKILVVYEPGFAKICRALMTLKGYAAETPEGGGGSAVSAGDYDLVITSYPYGADVVERMEGDNVPLLVLADCLSRDLLASVRSGRRTCCLIKPLDFDKFHSVVGRMLGDDDNLVGGYEIA